MYHRVLQNLENQDFSLVNITESRGFDIKFSGIVLQSQI